MVTGLLGAVARDSGDTQRAYELIAESAEQGAEAGVPWWEGGMLAELAALALNGGHVGEAETRARKALSIAEQIGDRPGRVFGVGLLAAIAAACGHQERAGQLWQAVAKEDVGAPLGGWRRHRDDLGAIAEPQPSHPHQGNKLTLDDAVALALQSST